MSDSEKKKCPSCGMELALAEARCTICNYDFTSSKTEDAPSRRVVRKPVKKFGGTTGPAPAQPPAATEEPKTEIPKRKPRRRRTRFSLAWGEDSEAKSIPQLFEEIRMDMINQVVTDVEKEMMERYHLDNEQISTFIFGSQTPFSDFDLNPFLPADLISSEGEVELKKEIKDIIDSKFTNEVIEKSICKYKDKEGWNREFGDNLMDILKQYHSNMCDIHLGSLDDVLIEGKVPDGRTLDPKDYNVGYKGLAKGVKLVQMASTGKHIGTGINVLESIDQAVGSLPLHSSEGYLYYIIQTTNIGKGFFGKEDRLLAKGISELSTAISIIAGEGVLTTVEEKKKRGKEYLGLCLDTKAYDDLLNESFEIREGFTKEGKLKTQFSWNELDDQERIKQKDKLMFMLDHFNRLFKRFSYETGIILDEDIKLQLKNYFRETSKGLIKTIVENGMDEHEVLTFDASDLRMLRLYTERLLDSVDTIDPTFFLNGVIDMDWAEATYEKFKYITSNMRLESSTSIEDKILYGRIQLAFGEHQIASEIFKELLSEASKQKLEEMLNKSEYASVSLGKETILSNIYEYYSKALIGTGALEDAKINLEEAIKRNPLNPELWAQLAKVFNRKGDREQEREYAIISEELDKGVFDVFKWQTFKGDEVKKLFKYWKEHIIHNLEEQRERWIKSYTDFLEKKLIPEYNQAQTTGNYSVAICQGHIERLNLISSFIRTEIDRALDLIKDDRTFSPISDLENVLEREATQEFRGVFPIYNAIVSSYTKKKRRLERSNNAIQREIDTLFKYSGKLCQKIRDGINEDGISADNIQAFITEGFIDDAKDATEVLLVEKPEKKESLQKAITKVENSFYKNMTSIRMELIKELFNLDHIDVSVEPKLLRCNCGLPIPAPYHTCPKCKESVLQNLNLREIDPSNKKEIPLDPAILKEGKIAFMLDDLGDGYNPTEGLDKDRSRWMGGYIRYSDLRGKPRITRAFCQIHLKDETDELTGAYLLEPIVTIPIEKGKTLGPYFFESPVTNGILSLAEGSPVSFVYEIHDIQHVGQRCENDSS